ncbi:anti-sigma factor [Saxibacter everestensis]|uniref:Regulator of SigK n=1 Tax=Saxibacter everestensis TaxID=2909229 RepID=A0ABY8QRK1_9MICO|nr:anti-sigma factor [Brevibacteriaceae bacterium ZFBP1038]
MDRSSDELLDLAEVYAMDALDDTERDDLAARLSQADEATRRAFEERARQARETLAALAMSNAIDPPAGLKADILAALPPQAGNRSRPTSDPSPDTTQTTNPSPNITENDNVTAVDFDPRSRAAQRRPNRVWLGLAAAVVIVAAAFGAGYLTRPLADGTQVAASILQADDLDTHSVTLEDGRSTTVATSVSEDAAVVIMDGFTDPPSNRVYQMWLIRDGVPVSAGVIDAGRNRDGSDKVAVIDGIAGASQFALTEEPPGGSKQPTSDPFASIELS